MKHLTLIRHAKSSWSDNQLQDYQRPLNDRGKKNAVAAGIYLRDKGFRTEKIFSSYAARARTTAELIKMAFATEVPMDVEERLYTFDAQKLLQFIYDLDNQWNNVVLVGHNPAMTELLNYLAQGFSIMNVATCGVIELSLGIDNWQTVEQSSAKVESFYTPKKIIV